MWLPASWLPQCTRQYWNQKWLPACWHTTNTRMELQLNSQVSLIATEDGGTIYLRAGAEQAILPTRREIFSFGSGAWLDGSDATTAMNDPSGNWLKCSVGLSSMIILEKRKIPAHLSELQCLDKALTLQELLLCLEDQGEVTRRLLMMHYMHWLLFSGSRFLIPCDASNVLSFFTLRWVCLSVTTRWI